MAVGTHRQVTRSGFMRNSSFLPACFFAGSQQRVCTQDLSFLIIALCNLLPGNKSVFVRKPWIMGKYAEMKMVFSLTWATEDNLNFSGLWGGDLPVPGVFLYPKQHSAVSRWWTVHLQRGTNRCAFDSSKVCYLHKRVGMYCPVGGHRSTQQGLQTQGCSPEVYGCREMHFWDLIAKVMLGTFQNYRTLCPSCSMTRTE